MWTPELEEIVKTYCEQGHSAKTICAFLLQTHDFKTTPNSVRGKLWRMGVASKAKAPKPPPPIKQNITIKPKGVVAPVYIDRHQEPIGIPLSDLGSHDCRFPSGTKGNYLFCGKAIKERGYCSDHLKLCYPATRCDIETVGAKK